MASLMNEQLVLRQATARILHVGLPSLAGMYALVSLFHLFRFSPPESWYLFAAAVMSALLLFGAHQVLLRIGADSGWIEAINLGALLLVLLKTNAVIALSQNPHYSVNILLLILGSGFLALQIPHLLGFHIVVLTSWLTILATLPVSEHLGYLLVPTGIALLLSYVIRQAVVNNILELEKARRIAEARRYDLEKALSGLEQEKRRCKEKTREAEFAHEILSAVSNLILVANTDGEIVYASPSIASRLGFDLDAVLGSGWFRLTRSTEAKAAKERQHVAEIAASSQKKTSYHRLIKDASGTEHWILWQDTSFKNGHLIGVGTDVTEQKRLQDQRDELLEELKQAYEKVEKLEGLLPICSHCKKVRDDRGYWSNVEAFIAKHSDAVFSHGICPDCFQLHYSDELSSVD